MQQGQALVEYALLIVLLVITFGVALAATGPAIGNVFGNVVYNLVGQDPNQILDIVQGPNDFWRTVTWVAENPQPESTYQSDFEVEASPTFTPLPANFSITQTHYMTETYVAGTSTAQQGNANQTGTSTALTAIAVDQTLTATHAPAATATDAAFAVPFVEQVNNQSGNRWRIMQGEGSNPDDVPAGAVCDWTTVSNNDSASRSHYFDETPADSGFGANRTCYLELRGYFDITSLANPRLSFWDVWDFTGSGNVSATLEVANVSFTDGEIDRTLLDWTGISLPGRTSGSANYNWTRHEVNLRDIPGFVTSNILTVRFKLQTTGAGGSPVRWNIDDFQVNYDSNPLQTYTLNKTWDLNNRAQMDEFVYTSDSDRTLERPPINGANPSSRRWDLRSDYARTGTAWSSGALERHSLGGTRLYELRIRRPIDLTTAAPTDFEGDTGDLTLSFWYAYDAPLGTQLRVEYSTDTTSLNPTWQPLTNGLLVDTVVPTIAAPNQQIDRQNYAMQRVQLSLESLKSAPFRLRFAAYVHNSVTAPGTGWYIDDIRIERRNPSEYHPYPFFDDAQNAGFTAQNWAATGAWGATNEVGGYGGSSSAYSDSPNTSYATTGLPTTMAITRLIDLLNDTPDKPVGDVESGRAAATNPTLSYWFRRETSSNVNLYVDLWVESAGTWSPIWTYDSTPTTVARINRAWERVEINLRHALQQATGQTWATITSNVCDAGNLANCKDDDIKIRFRMVAATSASPGIGFFIDNIRIDELPEVAHRLWAGGDGVAFEDKIDTVEPITTPAFSLPGGAAGRWYLGGWQEYEAPANCPLFFRYNETNNGKSLHDSPNSGCPNEGTLSGAENYQNRTVSIAEMRTIIDLTSTPSGETPILYFWTRRQIANNHHIRVEIARENTSDSNPQAYNDMGGWHAWEATTWTRTNERLDTWIREQIDLSAFRGQRIRIRFVLDAQAAGGTADGWYIDGVRVSYQRTQIAIPFTPENGNSMSPTRWVREGFWGISRDIPLMTGLPENMFTTPTSWRMDAINYTGGTPNYSSPAHTVPNIPQISMFMGNGAAYSGGPTDNFALRFRLENNANPGTYQVTLTPGTYTLSTISDDGVVVHFSTGSGTNVSSACTRGGLAGRVCLIERWVGQSATLLTRTFTVSSAVPREITAEYYEGGGDAYFSLSLVRDSIQYTDSPNPPSTGQAYPDYVANSLYYGNSSLMLNGYFNTNAVSGTQTLSYRRVYNVQYNTHFFTEYSTDGGFTWVNGAWNSHNLWGGADVRMPFIIGAGGLVDPATWDHRTGLNLPEASSVMIRFRLSTITFGYDEYNFLRDGMYIADIRVQ